MSRNVIELALTKHLRREADPNALATQLLAQYDAESLTETRDKVRRALELLMSGQGMECAYLLDEIAGEKSSREADATPELTVYRASHDLVEMGLYATAAAARAHCEAEERRAWLASDVPTFGWIEDEEDGVAEMTAWVGGEETETGYEVTAIRVPSEYAPEPDE